ncbi:DUF6221 family protein [Streptomyces scabiei]|nr:DUF6221 family protein [Streptomyces scabiei]MDX2566070.1 DUF6221 family protein [Streptomyces scabiei]MDX3149650.1 DUF6221 family protein [Streptomyces scabiei]MDX3288110.1 DUF6221 family protein [Streptomyces scabiei]
MDDLMQWLSAQLDEDERIARAASGGTVVGEPGNWRPAPGGDEWETLRTDCDEDELLVALRPGLPRPPDVMSGLWGEIVCYRPEFEDPGDESPLPQFEHAARHDPARVLREVEAKRSIIEQHERYAAERRRMMGGWDPQSDDSPILAALAAVYADRPGYREEWKP